MSSDLQAADKAANAQAFADWKRARALLGFLADLQPATEIIDDGVCEREQLVDWLVNNDLGALAQARLQAVCPELAASLQSELFITAAQNMLHWRNLRQIDAQLAQLGTAAVLLKGAALAETVYDNVEQRPMADVDLWLNERDLGQACEVMSALNFRNLENSARPLALQAISGGEIQYLSSDMPPSLVELHLSPFPGTWLQRTAKIEKNEIWSRKQPLEGWQALFHLAAEDDLIQIAVHLAVSHQFGVSPLRGLMDITLAAQARDVDWSVVGERAREWRVATAVWLALDLARQMIGTHGLDDVLSNLQPAAWRRRQLRRFVSPESILNGRRLHEERERYLYLLLLVDRPQDAGKLAYRTLWPEEEWLAARYGGSINRRQHLQRALQQRDI
jgi:Uncharacterised nucleotidyltransferase